MSTPITFRTLGSADTLAPLTAQLLDAGATITERPPSLVVVGATTIRDAQLLLLTMSPRLRRRAVLVGLRDQLHFRGGPYTDLLEDMEVLGALPPDCASTPHLTSFVGRRGDGEGLAKLVHAGFFALGPRDYKVWFGLPPESAGAFLVRLVRAIERAGVWFDEPARRVWEAF